MQKNVCHRCSYLILKWVHANYLCQHPLIESLVLFEYLLVFWHLVLHYMLGFVTVISQYLKLTQALYVAAE